MDFQENYLEIWGAREHNLKNIDLRIPRDKLVVITGLSGSGKSSLAFDTVYAEGQRRYLESFSAYIRQFLGNLQSPDVDKIEGLSPVIAIEQKTTSRNPRSTVGTVTEIYDLLRLLFARAADAYSHISGVKMVKMTDDQVIETVVQTLNGKKIVILAPLIRSRKGHYKELFENLAKQGYAKVRVDGEVMDIKKNMQLDRYKIHDIELVIDRAKIGTDNNRLIESIQSAMKMGEGTILLLDNDTNQTYWYSRNLMDAQNGISYDVPSPNTFSFNSPYGACPKCNGLGQLFIVDDKALVPDESLSITKGAIAPIGEFREVWIFQKLRDLGEVLDFKLTTPWKKISDEAKLVIMDGSSTYKAGKIPNFEGIRNFVAEQYQTSGSEKIKDWAEQFMSITNCDECHGTRLKKESLFFKLGDSNIADLAQMDLQTLANWMDNAENILSPKQLQIGGEVLKEISKRLSFLLEVGLEYLSMDRPAKTLSGGEAQRIRLATQIGSQLMGVLYILDEPSIGLHQRDNERLIASLKNLRDIGNSVIVVEHDKDMMLACDYLVDFGPGAGVHGGYVVAQGTPQEVLQSTSSTAEYLSGKRKIAIPTTRRMPKKDNYLILEEATGNNLKNVTLHLPLGMFVCISGVSGSGKSTLINSTLYPILANYIYKSKEKPLPYKAIHGLEKINKVIQIDQSPIGRTPRSNTATYTGLFSFIRDLFVQMPESQIRGYKAGRFSFNVKGGRCETCEGAGVQSIEMNFLPTVYVQCEKCQGSRYNRETLEVRYRGKSINDVLNMTVSDALGFFDAQPRIKRVLQTLNDVGLGYIHIGQAATTLSGGEAQRVKIATELTKRDTGNTIYILDEPTTGLHFQDIEKLLEVLQRLVEKGNSMIVIEHNMDVIKVADYVIDMGPEGGNRGGMILAEGTPEEVAKHPTSDTARFLREEIG